MNKTFLTVSAILFLAFSLSAGNPGTSALHFLDLGAGARAAAMGDNFTAVSDDATSPYWNPAGMVKLEKPAASVMHALWIEDISYDWVSYIRPFGFGHLGIGVTYASYGNIDETDTTGASTGDTFTPSDTAISLSYARNICEIPGGITVKNISSSIGGESASAMAIDLGILKDMMDGKLMLGFAVQNLGTKIKYIDEEDTLPMNIKLGAGYMATDKILLASDIVMPSDNDISFGLGAEYMYNAGEKLTVPVRAGYNTKSDEGGMNAGIGFKLGNYSLDYTFSIFGDLGNTQRISFEFCF
ncbi:MAG TPA: PorV/PorQ family protein [bacterium]|nr:PorV/PorQ family protein [bacterium]